MDTSRDTDLIRLHKIFNDPHKDKQTKQYAYRSFCSIQRQVKDKCLVEMRHRLIRATQVNDKRAIEQIEHEIDRYSRQKRLGQYSR